MLTSTCRYITKLQPILNGTSNTGEKPTLVLPERKFEEVVNVYTKKRKALNILQDGRATVIYESESELEEILGKLSQEFDIKYISKPKKNEYDILGKEQLITMSLVEKTS